MYPRNRPTISAPRRNHSLLVAFFLLLICVAGLVLLTRGTRAATTWHVSVGSPGACNIGDPNCATITDAVSNAAAGDTINVDAGTYNEHDITITKDLTINGAGAGSTIVDAQQLGRVFDLNSATVSLSGLTIRNGKTIDGVSSPEGGGFGQDGGGIRNETGTVTITSCAIINNATGNGGNVIPVATSPATKKGTPNFEIFFPVGGDAGYGAGIYNCLGGTMTLVNSTVSDNHTGNGGSGGGFQGGFGGEGAGIFNAATLTVINSTVANNQTGAGGPAGGVPLLTAAAPKTTGKDSGSAKVGLGSGGAGGEGGGIANEEGGSLNLRNSTVAFNQTGPGADGGLGGVGGGVYTGLSGTTFSPFSSIIAKNDVAAGGSGPDVFSDTAVNDQGFNLIGKTEGSTGFTQPTDHTGTIASPLDPQFDPAGLANNGGPTKTIGLQATSPAIDQGKKDVSLTNDQRGPGFPRISDFPLIPNAADGTDIGSFERQVPPDPCATDTVPPNITCPASITKYADPGQLGASINPGFPGASDNCQLKFVGATRSDFKPLNALYPLGTTLIVWTATDAKGNQASCTQTIVVMAPGADTRKVTP